MSCATGRVAAFETVWRKNVSMDSFRRIARDMREERQARNRLSSFGGRGHRFCEKHRKRFPDSGLCPECFPPTRVRVRR